MKSIWDNHKWAFIAILLATVLLGPLYESCPLCIVVVALMGIILCLIGTRKSQKKLLKIEARYRRLIENLGCECFFYSRDIEGNFTYVSPSVFEMLGYSTNEEIRNYSTYLSSNPVNDGVRQKSQSTSDKSNQLPFMVEARHKDDSVRWLEITETPIFADDGSIVAFEGVAHDVTDYKQAEENLVEAQNYISNIIDSMPSVLVGVDVSGVVTQWNRTAAETSGILAADALGKSLADVYPEMTAEMDKITESIGDQEIVREKNRFHQTDHGVAYEDLTIYPLVGNNVKGAVVRIDDVTKEYVLEEQLSHRSKMDAVGQLSGGVAHDFNNMLGGIMGAAELLKQGNTELDQENSILVDIILQATAEAAELTAKLLAFGRKTQLTYSAIDIEKTIDDIVRILSKTIDRKIKISRVKKASDHIVIGDDAGLQSTLLNLGINATAAMPDGGEMVIATKNLWLDLAFCESSSFDIKPGEYIEIAVQDSGTGIPVEKAKKIFEPFYTTKMPGQGAGLGLSAVYGIIQDHNGAITVYSDVNAGAVFRIYLPCSELSIGNVKIDNEVIAGTGKVLLVDDEKIIRMTTGKMLEESGYSVLLAENGLQAVDIFRSHFTEIDLVVMDMIMPELNGMEAFLEMKEIDSHCKVVIASGFTKQENLDEMRKSGLSGYIQKPFGNAELSRLVAEIMRK